MVIINTWELESHSFWQSFFLVVGKNSINSSKSTDIKFPTMNFTYINNMQLNKCTVKSLESRKKITYDICTVSFSFWVQFLRRWSLLFIFPTSLKKKANKLSHHQNIWPCACIKSYQKTEPIDSTCFSNRIFIVGNLCK